MKTKTSYVYKDVLMILLVVIVSGNYLNAQSIGVNYTGVAPHASALFDVDAAGGAMKGLLIPRMNAAQRAGIAGPATGLMVYQTDGASGFYYYNGSAWVNLSSGGGGSSQWTTSGNNIFYNTGNVGIGTGTVTPVAKLQVVGTGTTSSTYSGIFQNAAGVTSLYVKDDGKVSVGSTYGSSALDIRAQAIVTGGAANGYENLFNFTVTDVPNQASGGNDYISISNSTGTDGQFAPMISACYSPNNSAPSMGFRAYTPATNDNSAYIPLTLFDAYLQNTTSLTITRPLAQVRNRNIVRVSFSPTGSIFSGAPTANSGVDHSAQLVVVSTGSTSTTYTAKFRNSNGNDLVIIKDDGKVGIGVSNPSNLLQLSADDAVKPNGGSWSVPSDIRFKKDTGSFNDGLDLLKKIRPIKYKYNGLAGTPKDNKECVGISAQAMQLIAPSMVRTVKKELTTEEAVAYPYEKRFLRNDKKFAPNDTIGDPAKAISVPVYETDMLVFDPSSLVYILINSVKELDAANAGTKKENKIIKDENAAMRKELDDLKKRLVSIEAKQ